ncbi:WXG100 family type VII secretion target [uncultured Corynebacterium sp.]|uniref:WXG100 family type VII secretion target n=1 Tax=uncultured Corynebacterium sp. TaxID=159447 RepID=UPI0025FBE9A7|nr:WXG100 family type VII secretion target [uncultured Corynebacterium sp.]
MNGGLFTTESSTMTTTAADVDGVNQEVSGELARLRGVVDGLAGDWRGQAKVAFDDVMVRWDEAAIKLSGALTDIAENIRGNAQSFDAGEESGASDFNRVGAAGGGLLNL